MHRAVAERPAAVGRGDLPAVPSMYHREIEWRDAAAIRDETASDRVSVRQLNERAFGQPAAADLVEALHGAGAATISLVAEVDGKIVGHVVFSPMTMEPHAGKRLLGLAPMAVDPKWQRQGIGSDLVRTGLATPRR